MTPISCCSPTGRIVIAGEPLAAVAPDTLGDGGPAAPSQLRAAPMQVGVTAPTKILLREKPAGS
jgi:hypothetical protein